MLIDVLAVLRWKYFFLPQTLLYTRRVCVCVFWGEGGYWKEVSLCRPLTLTCLLDAFSVVCNFLCLLATYNIYF